MPLARALLCIRRFPQLIPSTTHIHQPAQPPHFKMGFLFSCPVGSSVEPDQLPTTETSPVPYHCVSVPQAAGPAPDISDNQYADFWEKLSCVLHSDGRHVIIGAPSRERRFARNPREKEGWATRKLRRVYEQLGEDKCDRIVRFEGVLEDGRALVERLDVGPLQYLTLPCLKIPVEKVEPKENRIILALYYRWALQALTALSFLHSHGVHAKFFSSQNVWLRADFSLAITGFISAIVNGDEDDHGEEDGWSGDEWIMYGGDDTVDDGVGSIKEDLFYWATFVWRLMTNEHTNNAHWKRQELWEPVVPLEGGILYDTPNAYSILGDRHQRQQFQRLEQERLGEVLVKAWTSGYEGIEEVIQNVRDIAKVQGLVVEGDEIEIEEAWEKVFEVFQTGELPCDRELRFYGHSGKDEL